jgi:lysophospholipase L1-like esterase
MRIRLVTLAFLAALAMPAGAAEPAAQVLLVGDSTMAPETGYGDALCARFQPEVACINLAKGGRSSSSYRAEGSWEYVVKLLQEHVNGTTYVLIQFGHNDQPGKPGRSTDLATEFPVNMARYVQEVKALHAMPVLVTPLSRRSFKQDLLQNDLRPWAEATIKVAQDEKIPVLDLNADSSAAVQAMGEHEADTLAMAPPPAKGEAPPAAGAKGSGYRGFDRTHLGAKGATVFSLMVEQEVSKAVPALATTFKTPAK